MVKLEVFSGAPPCPGCVAVIELAQRVAARYEGATRPSASRGCAPVRRHSTMP